MIPQPCLKSEFLSKQTPTLTGYKPTSGDLISGKAGTSMGGNWGNSGTLSSRSRIKTKLSSLCLCGGLSSTGDGDLGGGLGVLGYKKTMFKVSRIYNSNVIFSVFLKLQSILILKVLSFSKQFLL